jgi:glutamate-1-semialdehyde 2,1-aminomutase
MDLVADPNPSRRVLLAGTYNGHPVPVAAAIETMKLLLANDGQLYRDLEKKGATIENALRNIGSDAAGPMVVSRIGSAFCYYFMDHVPVDWHDILEHHDFSRDVALRLDMIARGIYAFPLAVKQLSISTAHTDADVEQVIDAMVDLVPTAHKSRDFVPIA